MPERSGCSVLWAVLALVFAPLSPASAQVFLKLKGQEAAPLLTRAITGDVTIDGQFATTRLKLTFQNETSEQIEADFIYTLAPDTVVTYFAYWYGDERVVARIVEKEKAAAIYQHITSRMRDPALVELIGKNKFRARIFPVMPNSDLKVEMTLVQALPSDETGVEYEFPLPATTGRALDRLKVNARVKPDATLAKVMTNYGVPVTRDSDGYRLELTGTNFRPPKSLRVRLVRRPQPLHAALYAALSGGQDGFFALALTPDRALTAPRVTVQGVPVHSLVPASLPGVRAHRTLALFGRYRGNGKAVVTLTGGSPQGPVTYRQDLWFGQEREPNNVASKLWAARRIEQLGRGDANRQAVVALSQRFTLPSPFTSWLAVPREEMKRYRQEKLEAELSVLASRLAREIAEGRRNGPIARRLRFRVNRTSRVLGRDPREELRYHLSDWGYSVVSDLFDEQYSPRPDLRRLRSLKSRIRLLEREAGWSARKEFAWLERPYLQREMEHVRTVLLAERRKEQPDPGRIGRLEARFTRLNGLIHDEKYAAARTERLAVRTDLEKLDQLLSAAPTPADTARLAALQQRREELRKRESELRVRMGDPLLRVEAPADAEQVVALMPDGEIKRLQFIADTRKWEARFDVPTHAREGSYEITVIVVRRDGTRQVLKLQYHVDITPPRGAAAALVVPAREPALRLELEADDDAARVTVLLPWGEPIALQPSARPRHFLAIVPLPLAHRREPVPVTFVLTDRAHNRTMLTVEATP